MAQDIYLLQTSLKEAELREVSCAPVPVSSPPPSFSFAFLSREGADLGDGVDGSAVVHGDANLHTFAYICAAADGLDPVVLLSLLGALV
jgi:hypothetical protein